MTDLEKVHELLRLEVQHWFKRACRDPFATWHWYFKPAKNGNTCGFLICKEQPINKEYQPLDVKIDGSMAPTNVLHHIKEAAKKLPC